MSKQSNQHILLIVGEGHQLAQSSNFSRLESLKNACTRNSVQIMRSDNITPALLSFSQTTVIVCGTAARAEILDTCRHLRSRGHNVIILMDCLEITDGIASSVHEHLEHENFQLSLTEGALFLINNENQFVYAYAKADIATSVVVLFEQSARVLLIKRKNEPFKGALALPGGFLRPLIEDMPTCAARELFEETGLKVEASDLRLVSVRSNPNRDRRGHVIDHGYCALIKRFREEPAVKALYAKDDAEDVYLTPIKVAMRSSLAADHGALLSDAMKMMHRSFIPSPLVMLKEFAARTLARA